MSTQHGDNIKDQINYEDAYGDWDPLDVQDVWAILDQLETHFTDHRDNDKDGRLRDRITQWKETLVRDYGFDVVVI